VVYAMDYLAVMLCTLENPSKFNKHPMDIYSRNVENVDL